MMMIVNLVLDIILDIVLDNGYTFVFFMMYVYAFLFWMIMVDNVLDNGYWICLMMINVRVCVLIFDDDCR